MTSRRNRESSFSIGESFKRLFGAARPNLPNRQRRRETFRRTMLESLENRELLAVNIASLSPADGSVNVPVDAPLEITFSGAVVKGQGNIHVVRQDTNTLEPGTPSSVIDVNDVGVVIDANDPTKVSIDVPVDLKLDSSYYVFIDDGAFKDSSTSRFPQTTVLTQDFELLPLDPFVSESGGDGTDFTLNPPLGWSVDNTNLPTGGTPEWRGWSFADKVSWANVDNQSRDAFTLASGTVAVADNDEFDDSSPGDGLFNSDLLTKVIDISGATEDSLTLDFDSSFRPEAIQKGLVDVRFDGGSWTNLLTLDSAALTDLGPELNEHRTFNIDSPANASTMQFRFAMRDGDNDWWWAVDNVVVQGEYAGEAFVGISDPTVWEFSTPESPKLSLVIDTVAISEMGGTATGTVSRNLGTTEAIIVDLTSSDTTEATVPAQVTIPIGQESATFTITAVDDLISDRAQVVTIEAANAVYANSTADITILDNEGPQLESTDPVDDATGVDYQTDYEATFDVAIAKGQGRVRVIETATNTAAFTLDINDPAIVVDNSDPNGKGKVSIPSAANLFGLTDYHVRIDEGALKDTSATVTENATLLSENFDYEPLGPAVFESNGDGTDWTDVPPLGFQIDDSGMLGDRTGIPPAPEWDGWSIADKEFWGNAGGQGRINFSRASGNLAVADPDEWDDQGSDSTRQFNSFLITSGVDLSTVAPGSISVEFDSSYLDEGLQIGNLYVSYNDGASWELLAFFDGDSTDEHVLIDSSTPVGANVGGGITTASLNDQGTGILKFRFGMELAGNNWWWAIDNIEIKGDVTGLPYPGTQDAETWDFTTAEAPTVTVTTAVPAASEGAGTIKGTVARNLSTSGALTVDLQSSDTTAATVPTQVTIPDGASSVEFDITLIDDAVADGTQTTVISVTPPQDFFAVNASLDVLDDDFPMIDTLVPADDSTDVPVEQDFQVTFDQTVKKGNGFVHILRADDGKTGISMM